MIVAIGILEAFAAVGLIVWAQRLRRWQLTIDAYRSRPMFRVREAIEQSAANLRRQAEAANRN